MDVRYGPARVTFSGDPERAHGHLATALHRLRTTQERQRLGGLNVLGGQWRLDEDSYCYVVLAGGIAAVHIVAGYADEAAEPAPAKPAVVPDFLSGVVRNGYIRDVAATDEVPAHKTLESFRPTRACAMAYDQRDGGGYRNVDRLAVEPWTAFDELRNEEPPPVYSQYVKLKPTMYSGTMRRVVQALMGFGRQRTTGSGDKLREISLYDRYPGEADAGTSAAPAKYAKDVAKQGLQIRYDWRFARTHGITRAADGRLWLVEIGVSNGILAMPLPLHPMTTTPEFADWIASRPVPVGHAHERANDPAVATMLEWFGGLPTGEAFPPGAEIDAWVRAGRVLRLATHEDLAPFYAHTAYSSAMGWAFNLRGDEAHNTANRVGDDGFLRGVHYMVALGIGPTQEVDEPNGAGELAERLAILRNAKPEPPAGLDAAIWKCRRLTPEQVREARRLHGIELFAFVDAIEAPPLATGHGGLHKVSEGYLYQPGRTGNLVKFPEPAIGLLVSVDMRAELVHADIDPRSDTTVHVFFAGNELKWVKYFRDPRPGVAAVIEDDYEPCMYVGSWHRHQESGGRQILPALYSNDFDDRMETSPSVTDTTIKGTDLGYYGKFVTDCLPWLPHAWFWREKRFRRETVTRSVTDGRMGTGVAVPFQDREAYYYAVHERDGGRTYSRGVSYLNLRDPWDYRTFRVFGGYTSDHAAHPDGCGIGPQARTVMKPGHFSGLCRDFSDDEIEGDAVYRPGGCSDFADEGPWSSLCVNADAERYFIPAPPTESEFVATPPAGHYDIWLVSSSGFGPLRVAQEDSLYFGMWPLISPFNGNAEISADQSIATTSNALGAAQSIRYQVNLNDSLEVRGIPNWPEMASGALTYIGVIDGE